MNEDALNMQIRKFLKKTGITSQRSIEQAVYDGLDKGKITKGASLAAKMTLTIDALDLKVEIDENISVDE